MTPVAEKQTCGTCKHKGEPIEFCDWQADDPKTRQTGYFLCGLIKHHDDDRYTRPDKEKFGSAYVKDGSGYYAALCVADDFGCNRWEPA